MKDPIKVTYYILKLILKEGYHDLLSGCFLELTYFLLLFFVKQGNINRGLGKTHLLEVIYQLYYVIKLHLMVIK
jgi:hypothetical protein